MLPQDEILQFETKGKGDPPLLESWNWTGGSGEEFQSAYLQ